MAYSGWLFLMGVCLLSLFMNTHGAPNRQIIKELVDSLEQRVTFIEKHTSQDAYKKYTDTYFPKSQPYLLTLGLLSIANKTFTVQERNGKTADIYLTRIVKLLITFIKPVKFAINDEKQPGAIGNLSKELKALKSDLSDLISIAKKLYTKITAKQFPFQLKSSAVTRASLNKIVKRYKSMAQNKRPVNILRNWSTLDEIKYALINQLYIEIDKVRNALSGI